MQNGKIGVTTENIFPIIKKFLYSDHEIFLRELVSNGVDATQKLKALASMGEFKGELGDLTVRVSLDTDKRILTISDSGIGMTAEEIDKFRSAMLYEFAVMDAKSDWVQQFHYGATRNNNARMFKKLGPDTGYDAIGDAEVATPLARFLSRLDEEGMLAKSIFYNLNPRDNELLMTTIYSFNDGTVPGKMQYGSGWWFLDQIHGMEKQMNALSDLGLLSRFVGMLTDSRSFLSYPRHEYFRRILCNILGREVEDGLLPASELPFIGKMVEDISYNNAKGYFGF